MEPKKESKKESKMEPKMEQTENQPAEEKAAQSAPTEEQAEQPAPAEEQAEQPAPTQEQAEQSVPTEEKKKKKSKEKAALEALQKQLDQAKGAMLRLAAEYDNFRKRSQKEKDEIYLNAKADVAGKFLPVYDNLERALSQPTEDAAYKKGVEMTMTGLRDVMSALGVEEFGQVGEPFDPNRHNAVMHTEDENLAENTVSQVFAKGFRIGDKVIRFAMVQVAN